MSVSRWCCTVLQACSHALYFCFRNSRASVYENCRGLLTASPRGWGWGREETYFFGASPSFSCSALALVHSLRSHARRFSKRKRKQRLVQASTTVALKFKHYKNHTICVGSLCCQRQRGAKRRNTKYISLLPTFCLHKHIF